MGEWPKTCQYNTPGCTLYEMGSSGHSSEMHKEMVRKTERWAKAISGTEKEIRLSFCSMVDEDLEVLLEHVRNSDVVREIDYLTTSSRISARRSSSLFSRMRRLCRTSRPCGATRIASLRSARPWLPKALPCSGRS